MAPAAAVHLAAAVLGSNEVKVNEVWSWNLEKEFAALLAAAACEADGAILALDVEFPGFLRQEPRSGARSVRYQALRENVDRLHPIQVGAAVASSDGRLRGAWSFNLRFDVDADLHTVESIAFLREAGIDFPRHAAEGIEATSLGRRLAGSSLVGQHGRVPWWVTFSGSYDLGYLLKLLTSNRPLPRDSGAFDVALSAFCPRRHELRDELPYGSLDSLARRHGVQRHGLAHTAGSDALLTLELFLCVAGEKVRPCDSRWTSWGVEESWHNQTCSSQSLQNDLWYQSWDAGMAGWEALKWQDALRWQHHQQQQQQQQQQHQQHQSAWNFPFLGNTTPSVPWPSTGVPSLTGGAPVPSAAFWGVAVQAACAHGFAMKLPPVPPVDPIAAVRKTGWWMPEGPKVMEI